jgi:RNA polymerase sigma-70 factor (ECF subfamily)
MAQKEFDSQKREETFLRVYEESYDRVARYMFVRVGNRQTAEDLTSETFAKALEALDSYQDRGLPMEAWIFKIAYNIFADYVREKKKAQLVMLDESVTGGSSDVEEITEQNDHVERLASALERLTPGQREVIILRFFSDLNSVECARILGKRPGAVRELQSAGLKMLRQVMKEEM